MSNNKEEFFPNIAKIEYKGPDSTDPFSFRHYNAEEIIHGKPMKEWLRFSVCWWHTFVGGGGRDPFGAETLHRPWETTMDTTTTSTSSTSIATTTKAEDPTIQLAKRRIDVAFEFFTKLGVKYYAFHDFDVAPESEDFEESLQNVDIITDYLLEKQTATGIKLLWATQNLFTHRRYMNGAMTNPDLHVFCYAAAQIQKVADVIAKLGGENHVFWGGREGYQTLLNTNMKRECDHMASMLRMVVDYKKRKGYTAQFLIEPKPREPCKHQYDYDAQTTLCFLQHYGLASEFKLNIEPNHTTLAGHAPEHDIAMASAYNMLGSIDSNTGDPFLGWDTDQFPMDIRETTAIMNVVLQQGGIAPGGLNFDAKVRRESIDPEDLFVAHIAAMDCYALGLRKAVAMHETMQTMVEQRYLSWTTIPLGTNIEAGQATLEECVEYAQQQPNPPQPQSGKQELYEAVRNRFLYG
jgi:xylose isomerase